MSVVGLDVGNANCFVAVARSGGIETVANEYSDRCTPSVVAFNAAQRLVGISAKNQMVMNFKSSVTQFKRLIGRKFDEPDSQEEMKRHPTKFIRMENGDIGVEVQYKGDKTIFKPEQCMTMLLSELKNTAETNLNTKVTDCVISIPSYYTDYQRRSLKQAIDVAGIKCLKLMNDTTAVALNYGLFRQDLPAPEEKSRNIAFVDCGHSAFQVCIAAFNKGKVKVLSTASDNKLGGRDFDEKLKNYFADAFLEKYKIDARSNPRAWLRLGMDVEKIKKQMSTNATDLPLNIECFMDDKDVSHKINRTIFEELSQDILARVEAPLLQAIEGSGLSLDQIDVVELIGGASRTPALKSIIEKTFNRGMSTTLNLDEAVARGCAIQCAMLSHTVRVRDIEVLDAAPFPINISWDSVKAEEPNGDMEVFKRYHAYPFTKLLTFPHRVEPFRFKAYYRDDVQIHHFERNIGEFVVNAVPPTESTEKVKVKVKLRLDMNGCFTVSSATQVETLPPAPEPEVQMETNEITTNGEAKVDSATSTEEHKEEEMKTEEKKGETKENGAEPKTEPKTEPKPEDKEVKQEVKKAKKSTKSTDLIVTAQKDSLASIDLNALIEIENDLISTVRLEKMRADAKNAVEEYIYSMRDKIYSDYEKYISESDAETFSSLLSQAEDWLYEEGEYEKKQAYVDKLAELKKLGQPVADRCVAHQGLPSAFESFGSSITHFRKILDLYANKDEKYAHLDEAEIKKVAKKVEEKQQWFNQKMQENGKCPPHVNPPVYPSQVLSEKKLLDDFCNPIVNKAKPKVEPPKDTPKKENDAPKAKENDASKADENPKDSESTSTTADETNGEKMDTDQTSGNKDNLDMEVD